jgi:DNA-directed RNA polymerase specialized sigma24 family protein
LRAKSGLSPPVAELARRCADEMARYRRWERYDPRHCYDLFHRALEGRDEEAWAALYSQYHRLVRRWLGNVPGDPDALVNWTFERFWRALPPDRFADFPTLAKILEYLKRCAQCVAIDARRREERKQIEEAALARTQEVVTSERRSSSERVLDEIVGEQLYKQALECLNSPQERLVFRASFEWNLKPGTIAERWPDTFSNAREVSRIKERILRRLRRDEGLRALLGITGEDSGKNERQSLYVDRT